MKEAIRLKRGQRRLPRHFRKHIQQVESVPDPEYVHAWLVQKSDNIWTLIPHSADQMVPTMVLSYTTKGEQTMQTDNPTFTNINMEIMNADDGFDVAWGAAHTGGAMFTRKSYKAFKGHLRDRGFANANQVVDESEKFVSSVWGHPEGQALDVTYNVFKYRKENGYDVTGTLVEGAVAPATS